MGSSSNQRSGVPPHRISRVERGPPKMSSAVRSSSSSGGKPPTNAKRTTSTGHPTEHPTARAPLRKDSIPTNVRASRASEELEYERCRSEHVAAFTVVKVWMGVRTESKQSTSSSSCVLFTTDLHVEMSCAPLSSAHSPTSPNMIAPAPLCPGETQLFGMPFVLRRSSPLFPFVVLITRSNHLKLNSFSYHESGADPPSPDIPGQPTNQKSISTMQEDEVNESSMRAREREDAISQVERKEWCVVINASYTCISLQAPFLPPRPPRTNLRLS